MIPDPVIVPGFTRVPRNHDYDVAHAANLIASPMGRSGALFHQAPLLLDVTRLISRSWTGRRSTGIDRVCYAYLRHFASRALAVVQHRGVVRVLNPLFSRALFNLLLDDAGSARTRLATFTPRALTVGCTNVTGGMYLNVSHTDFDLASHARWVRRNVLKSVYLIHDLIPLTHGHHCRPRAVQRHRGRVIGALQHGAGIVVGSKAVADDLKNFIRNQKLVSPPTLVAPLAGETLRPVVRAEARDSYFLCVGTIESRKNHVLLLDVWRELRARLGEGAPQLVIVGQWGSGAQRVYDSLNHDRDLQDHVTLIERCSDDRLADLMAGARAMLMPTLAEGFGLPMAEALSLGVPVIASDLPCFHEVGQGVPCLLNPHDSSVWVDLITKFNDDHPERRRQIEAVKRYRPSTWHDHFTRLERWLPTLSGEAAETATPRMRETAAYLQTENAL